MYQRYPVCFLYTSRSDEKALEQESVKVELFTYQNRAHLNVIDASNVVEFYASCEKWMAENLR